MCEASLLRLFNINHTSTGQALNFTIRRFDLPLK